jgi:kynurenine 3-monooxygenase
LPDPAWRRSGGRIRRIAAAFAEYEKLRKINLDTLADLCVENFIEMRDRVGSRWFLLRKRLGLFLHGLFPRWYKPLYTMVEFTRIPYAVAVRRARMQDWVVRAAGCLFLLLLSGVIWALL